MQVLFSLLESIRCLVEAVAAVQDRFRREVFIFGRLALCQVALISCSSSRQPDTLLDTIDQPQWEIVTSDQVEEEDLSYQQLDFSVNFSDGQASWQRALLYFDLLSQIQKNTEDSGNFDPLREPAIEVLQNGDLLRLSCQRLGVYYIIDRKQAKESYQFAVRGMLVNDAAKRTMRTNQEFHLKTAARFIQTGSANLAMLEARKG